jgi:methylmalonyl-CoA/ethylmalonyl-CoA epimerase
MANIELKGIGQIHITVDDLAATVAFYRDVLGMRLLFEVPEQSMAFFDCGGLRLYFGAAEGLDRPSHPVIYYRVDDIAGTCDELERRGVAFDGPAHPVHRTETMELWLAFFDDPEGNKVALMEERAVASS